MSTEQKDIGEFLDLVLEREPETKWRQAVVTSVNVGPPKTVTIKLGGQNPAFDCRYFDFYVPTNGDTVWVKITNGDPIVVGDLA